MHPLAGFASWFVLRMFFVLLPVDGAEAAENIDNLKVLEHIAAFANDICEKVPLTGASGDVELTGKGKAELNKLLKKIVNLGVEGAAKYQASEYKGLLQQELAEQLNRSRDCKREVSKDLINRLLSEDSNTRPADPFQPEPKSSSGTSPRGVSTITKFQLPGQPMLYHDGSNDAQYREAKEILESAADRQGTTVDRIEVIKWVDVDRAQARQLWEELLWELKERGYDYNYSPANMSPLDPRRDSMWTELYRFSAKSRATRQPIIGYWGVGYLGNSNYVLLWAWALLP